MASTVAGLTKNEAAWSSGMSAATGLAWRAGMTAYSAQFPPLELIAATRFPSTSLPSNPGPAFSTTPTPSKPGVAGNCGRTPYRPRTTSRSDGLTGLAIIRTRTSPGPGSGTGTSRTCNTSAGSPNRSKTAALIGTVSIPEKDASSTSPLRLSGFATGPGRKRWGGPPSPPGVGGPGGPPHLIPDRIGPPQRARVSGLVMADHVEQDAEDLADALDVVVGPIDRDRRPPKAEEL